MEDGRGEKKRGVVKETHYAIKVDPMYSTVISITSLISNRRIIQQE